MKRQSTGRGWASTLLLGFAIASLAAATMTSYVIIGQDAGRQAQVENEIDPPVLTQAPEVGEPIVLPAPSEQPAPLPGDSVDETVAPVVAAPAVVAQAPATTETTNEEEEPESFEGGLQGDSDSGDGSVGGTVSDVLDRGQVGPSDTDGPDEDSDDDDSDDSDDDDSEDDDSDDDDSDDDDSEDKGKGHDGSVESHQGGMSLNEDDKEKTDEPKSKDKDKGKGGDKGAVKEDDDQVLIEEDDDDAPKSNGKDKDSASDDSEASTDTGSSGSGSGDE
jgi:hypothetical protein